MADPSDPMALDPALFRRLADSANQPIGIATPDRNLLYANHALRELIGIEPDSSLKGWDLERFLPAAEAERLCADVLPQVLKDGEWQGDFILAGRDGKPRHTLRHMFALHNEHGDTEAVACIFTPLDEIKAREQSLTRANQLLGAVFEFTHLMVAYLDPDMNFQMVNRAYALADDREPHEFPGHNHFDFYPNPEVERIFREVARTGEPYHALARPFEYAHNPERGTSYWDWSLIPTRNAHGHVTGLVLTLLDVTERMRAMEALHINQSAIDSAGSAIAITDINGDLTYVNRAFVDLWQLSGPEAALGRNALEFWEDQETAKAVIDTLHAQNEWHGELVSQDADGHTRCLEVVAHRVQDAHGQPAHLMASFVEVTARREAERMLRQERDFAKRLIDNAPIIILSLDAEGRIQHINPYFEDLAGYSLEEVRDQPFVDIYLHPDDQEATREGLRKAFEGTITRGQLLPIITRAGERREIEWNDQLLRGPAGHPVSLLGIGQDVTELRTREVQLERFKTTLDQTLDCVFMFDAHELGFFYANRGAQQQVGYSEIELSRMHPYDLKPDYSEAQFRKVLEPLLSGRKDSVTFETSHRHREGHETPVEVFLQYIAPANEPPRFVAIVRDIRERRAAQEALRELNRSLEADVRTRTEQLRRENQRNRLILESTPEGFFAADTAGAIRAVNPAFCTMLGYNRAQLLEMAIADFEAIEDHGAVADHMERVIRHGHERFDTRHRRRDGRVIDVEVSVSHVHLGEDPIFYAFVRDITSRKELQSELMRSRDAAEQANAAKSEFLSRMSHELRTPLNAILGFSQLLEQDPEEPPSVAQQDQLREIRNAGDHLLGLVNDVLDLSRIETGHLEVKLEPVALEPVVQSCAGQFRTLMNERGIRLEIDLAGSPPLLADPLRLRQVLTNLISNAAKYNGPGGRIRVDYVDAGGGRLAVRIHDTGPGIPTEDLPRLFQPFERLEATAQETEGTGIGLALTRRVTEAMDGRIGVESESGAGSTFWFELPVAQADTQPQQHGKAPQTSKGSVTNGSFCILYVEDNLANLRLVQRILARRASLDLISAATGEEGLELARQSLPDLILMDLHLPGMDGHDVLRHLKDDPETRNIPVIAVSANAMPHDVAHGRAAGFANYVTKPIEIASFLETLERYLPSGGKSPQ